MAINLGWLGMRRDILNHTHVTPEEIMDIDWSNWTEWIQAPLRIVVIILVAFLLRMVLRVVIDRLIVKMAGLQPPKKLFGSGRAAQFMASNGALSNERRQQRAEALGSLFKSLSTAVIMVIVAFMCLSELGYDLAPLIASAGVVGVALGFGAQNLVRDFLSGVFMLVEDQYGVGDFVDLGEATGYVEGVGLRVTKLRDFDGIIWYVRNGEVLRVGNSSQGWSALMLDVEVGPDTDIDRARTLIDETAQALAEDAEWGDKVVQTPEVIGVQGMNGISLTIRIWGKCAPNQHWAVQRELRRRIKEVFDREGIYLPMPLMPWSTTPS